LILTLIFLTVAAVKRSILHQHIKFQKDRSNPCEGIAIIVIFQHGIIQNFNGRSTVWGQYVSSCQISSKSIKWLQKYGNLTFFFQNGGRLPFWIHWA